MFYGSIVAVEIKGGLGNQLFEYCTARSLADRLQCELVLDCSEARDRPIELSRFLVRAQFVHSRTEVRKTWLKLPGTIGRKISKGVQLFLPTFISIEGRRFYMWKERPSREFDHGLMRQKGNVYLSGYWQSYRYFENDIEVVRADLQLKAPCRKVNEDWRMRIKQAAQSVCVHVRRGDYLIRQDEFGLCSASYYRKAMALLKRQFGSPEFFVFSDDLNWCRVNFTAGKMNFVDANGPESAVEELELMRSCTHHIIANSTMSWWAAWLSQSQGQIVIAPYPWFLSGGPPEDDLLLKHWIRLDPR